MRKKSWRNLSTTMFWKLVYSLRMSCKQTIANIKDKISIKEATKIHLTWLHESFMLCSFNFEKSLKSIKNIDDSCFNFYSWCSKICSPVSIAQNNWKFVKWSNRQLSRLFYNLFFLKLHISSLTLSKNISSIWIE